VVNINTNISAAATITLDANRTVGSLLVGDLDSTHAFTVSGNTLILDQVGVAPALVRMGSPGAAAGIANIISSTIQLTDSARFITTMTTPQQLTGVISGAGLSLTFDKRRRRVAAGSGGAARAVFGLGKQHLYRGHHH
jgi:hypothetical protein